MNMTRLPPGALPLLAALTPPDSPHTVIDARGFDLEQPAQPEPFEVPTEIATFVHNERPQERVAVPGNPLNRHVRRIMAAEKRQQIKHQQKQQQQKQSKKSDQKKVTK